MPLHPDDLPQDFGWTSYKRLGWANKNGQRYYEVHLRSLEGLRGWTTLTIRFWATRPLVSLKKLIGHPISVRELRRHHEQYLD